MALDWTLTLKDRLSDPADKGTRALKGLAAGLAKVRAEEARQARLAEIVARDLGRKTNGTKALSAAEVKSASIRKQHYSQGLAMEKLGKRQVAQLSLTAKHEKAYQSMLARRKHFANDSYAKKSGVLNYKRPGVVTKGGGPGGAGKAGAAGSSISGGALLGVAGIAAAGITAFMGGMASMSMNLGAMIGMAQEFRSSTLIAFEHITKTKEGAAAAYKMAQKTALETGGDYRESIASMNSLMAQGFDVKFADNLVRMMADLKTINPAARLDGITRAISQIKSTGKLQGDEMMQLAEAGLNVGDVYKQIAKDMGIVDGKKGKKGVMSAVEQVQALQKDGKISSDVAIKAIMATIKAQTGGKDPGTIAASKADKTLTGAVMRAHSLKEMFLESVNIDWSPITSALSKVGAVMSGPAGEKFSAKISAGFGKMLGFLDSISEKDMSKMLDAAGDMFLAFADSAVEVGEAIMAIVHGVIWLNDAFKSVSGGSYTFFNAIWTGIKSTLAVIVPGGVLVQAFWGLGDELGAAGEWIASTSSAVWGAITGWISSTASSVVELASTIASSAAGIGSNIIDGIVSGISNGAASIVDSLVSACESAIEAAEEALGIESPSKVMRVIGRFTAKGMAKGVDDETPTVATSGYKMAGAAARAGATVAAASQASQRPGSTSTSSRSTVVNNHFSGGTAEENARAFSGSMRTLALTGAS